RRRGVGTAELVVQPAAVGREPDGPAGQVPPGHAGPSALQHRPRLCRLGVGDAVSAVPGFSRQRSTHSMRTLNRLFTAGILVAAGAVTWMAQPVSTQVISAPTNVP